MTAALPVPSLEPAFDVHVELGALEDHGPTRAGHRRVAPIAGGTLRDCTGTGAFDGVLLPGGADWQIIRPDGALEIDCRYSARLDDGSLLYLQVRGVRSGSPEVLESLLAGAEVDPSDYYFRTSILIEASAPQHAALEHAIFVAACARDADAVRYRAYRVS